MSRASGIPINLGKSLEESLTPTGRLSADTEAAIRGAAQNRSASISLRLVIAELDACRTELTAALAREAKLRDVLTAAVVDIETLWVYAQVADSYRFAHGIKPAATEAERGQRIIRNQGAARALLAEQGATSGETD